MNKYNILLVFILSFQQFVIGQDSISIEDLEKFTYSFSIQNGQFEGGGGDLLKKAISESHITMLAEDVGSTLEHQFTNALINELDLNNFKQMVLEVGGASGELINRMVNNDELNTQNIKELNQKYLLNKEGRTFIPILEFRSIEAMQSLENARNKGWSFLSVGVEPWTSYKMHADNLFANLLPDNQKTNQSLYEETIKFLDQEYEKIKAHNSDEVYSLISNIKANGIVDKFLKEMSICEGNLKPIKAIQQSIEYYWMYGNKKFYEKNVWSAKQDKLKLATDLKERNFDFKKDKLFVKMWRNHLSKSMTISGAYGVGNMLLELASYHGNESLTIGMMRRFYKDGDDVADLFNATDGFNKRYKELVQLGKENEWVVIDLRPFVKEFYYGNYIQSDGIYKMFTRYDMLVIPKLDEAATNNY